MATEVNQNYFVWSQDESSAPDISQGATQVFGHGSISFGRFDLESLEWEKWSVFANDKRHEEFEKLNGLVAKKKAYFEEYFRRIRELKALQQQNQQTELNIEYNGDDSDSSQTGEYEPAAGHGAPTESGTVVDDSMQRTTAATTFEMECYGFHDNGGLVNEISASTHSSPVHGLEQVGKQMRGNDSGKMNSSRQYASSFQDDPGMAHETMITPKKIVDKDSRIGQASKIIPKTVKTTSSNVPDHTIITKGSCPGKPHVMTQMGKPENILLLRRARETAGNSVGATSSDSITGSGRPSSAAPQWPSTRERRPATIDSSRKPAEVTASCRPSTSERRPVTRSSTQRHGNNATPCRPSTADRRTIRKESAPKQSNISTPRRPSTADKRPIPKESVPKLSNIATPHRPSTADRRPITKQPAPKLSNIATPHRPSTGDRRPITKESAPKQFILATPHRPSTGERRPITRDMAMKHVGINTSCQPTTNKQRPVTRESAHKNADGVNLCRPSTAERRPLSRDVALKHAIAAPLHRPSTAERRPAARNVGLKHAPPCRPSTSERRPIRETAPKQGDVARSRWPLTPDRCLTKKSDISTPLRPSTGERRPITKDSTPIRLRARPIYSEGAMVTAVTPQKAKTPSVVKSSEPENIRYEREVVKLLVDGKRNSSSCNLPPRKMLTSNLRADEVQENFRKPNKEGLQERVRAQGFKSNNVTPQTGSVKMRVPVPPPPPPLPRRPSCTEGKPTVNNSPVGGRKPKVSTPHWH